MSEGKVRRLKIAEVQKRIIYACVDDASMWVQVDRLPDASQQFGPTQARKYAHMLEAAANAAENIARFPGLYSQELVDEPDN